VQSNLKWHSSSDKPWVARPITLTLDENSCCVTGLTHEGRHVKTYETVAHINILPTRTHEICHDIPSYRNMSTHWVPKQISEHHKQCVWVDAYSTWFGMNQPTKHPWTKSSLAIKQGASCNMGEKDGLNDGNTHRGAHKSLAWPTSRCILFDGEKISSDASLVLYIYIYIHTHTHTYTHTYI
jgi:hypothetical protein